MSSRRSDCYIIEPVPGIVLYKVTRFREPPKTSVSALRFPRQSAELGDTGTEICLHYARGLQWTRQANRAHQYCLRALLIILQEETEEGG
jgi:hypothetical protein